MNDKHAYKVNKKLLERKINYIPIRYIIAALISILEVVAIIGGVVALCILSQWFYLGVIVAQLACVLRLMSSDGNPDYKLPWLFFILAFPVIGFMLHTIFASRKLKRKYIKRLKALEKKTYEKDDSELFEHLKEQSPIAYSQAKMLCSSAYTHLFTNTAQKYFSSGEEAFKSMLIDLENAQRFIYLEFFIIDGGKFWNSILEILCNKVKQGVEVKVLYDDIGCMKTLPGDYYKTLNKVGIKAATFSRLKGNANSEFNNRNHRKLLIIDGSVVYTGGINLADEYINEVERFGHWKDTAIRLEGEACWEFTSLFVTDYGISVKKIPQTENLLYPACEQKQDNGFIIPFGDGPKPIYEREVGKGIIQSMLANATKYAYITTPYLVIDNDICQTIEDTALRGVKVKIVVPHVPDKKIIFAMTKSYYSRLMKAGVEIYEYEPGFIHAKTYVVDDEIAMLGTINLDYRSLVHHFENGVWMYKCECIKDIKKDVEQVLSVSVKVSEQTTNLTPVKRFVRAILRIFAPLM
ncbi:MAG: cardiolipin synthase [Clostridia bacterium]|nr:cardiolipin synthase [Clostridia bacterium]